MKDSSRNENALARRAWVLSFIAYAAYYFGRKGFGVAKKSIERDLGIGREGLAAIDTGHLALGVLRPGSSPRDRRFSGPHRVAERLGRAWQRGDRRNERRTGRAAASRPRRAVFADLVVFRSELLRDQTHPLQPPLLAPLL